MVSVQSGAAAGRIEAFIFDMDDTLIATAALWRDAEEHLLRTIGASWSPELASKYKGMNALDLAATVWRELSPSLSLAECQRVMRDRLLENFRRAPIREIEGATQLVQRCAALAPVPLGVASGSPMEAIQHALDVLGIRDQFQCVITSESVPRGKPSPDVFLAAARQLSVPPPACLVFEDSLIGAQAAQAAGMRCVVRPSLANTTLASVATRVVAGWDEVAVEDLAVQR